MGMKYTKKQLQLIAEAQEKAKTCAHPVERQVKMGCGIFCDMCKLRVGFITEEEFMQDVLAHLKSKGVT